MAENRHNRVLVGEFGRAHGIRGEVRLKSHTGDPGAIIAYNPLEAEDGAPVVLLGLRPVSGAPDMFVTRVEGIASREAAEALTRGRLYVPRDRLQVELDDDEVLQADVIGARVEDETGAVIGRVVAFHDFGGGDVVEIAPAPSLGRKPNALLPFTKAFVPVVDVAGGRLVVAAGSVFGDDDDDAPRE